MANRSAAHGTGAPDPLSGVVSVLYHALQSEEAYRKYSDDAHNARDEELEQFFENCCAEERERAVKARTLLLYRLEDEEVDDDEDERVELRDQ